MLYDFDPKGTKSHNTIAVIAAIAVYAYARHKRNAPPNALMYAGMGALVAWVLAAKTHWTPFSKTMAPTHPGDGLSLQKSGDIIEMKDFGTR